MGFFSEFSQVPKLTEQRHPVVFFAESRFYYACFRHLLEGLLQEKVPVVYITADKHDPLLDKTVQGLEVIHLRWLLGYVFPRLKADVVLMTMPDLNHFFYKRSPGVNCYLYVFHAAVSTHQQYHKEAFFHYDAILCAGDYMKREIRAAEELYGQRSKELIDYGYPLFDMIARKRVKAKARPVILIAPSWHRDCILETCIEELVDTVVSLPCDIWIRAHPEYARRYKKKYRALIRKMQGYANCFFDREADVIERIVQADVLITDRSGIALEFAFGTKRPVLFIDTPPKITNAGWRELPAEPIENSVREQIGVCVSPHRLGTIPGIVQNMLDGSDAYEKKMSAMEQDIFFTGEAHHRKGIDFILGRL